MIIVICDVCQRICPDGRCNQLAVGRADGSVAHFEVGKMCCWREPFQVPPSARIKPGPRGQQEQTT